MASILVVDDHEAMRHLLRQVISGMGHEVTEACNGAEALDLCHEHRFDLLVLDYRMPGMDGLEVAERLRGKARFILHTSDYDDAELKRKALNAGALSVIAKAGDVGAVTKAVEASLRDCSPMSES